MKMCIRDRIEAVIQENNLKAIMFIWDEFTEYFRNNMRSLTGFQRIVDLSSSAPFYMLIVTHDAMHIFPDGDKEFGKIRGRFIDPICEISLPDNMAFRLMGSAMTKKEDPQILQEWEETVDELCDRTQGSRKPVSYTHLEALKKDAGKLPSPEVLKQAKLDGFSDKYLSQILDVPEEDIRKERKENGIVEAWEGVHVSGTENSAYYYSSYHLEDRSPASGNGNKIMILGGGPNRIGQGIEFDYCCVHAAKALKSLGFETIIVNCNPETVSTDYDTSDKLYFEPLTLEDVLSIYEKEKPLGVIAQFGGQTPLNLAADLKKNGVNILGTTPETIDLAEDRDLSLIHI